MSLNGQKLRKKFNDLKASMRLKITMGLGSIAVMLLISSIISVMEYSRMSNYVTDLITANIKCINVAQKLSKMCEEHNLKVLSAIGEEGQILINPPEIDEELFLAECDSLKSYLAANGVGGLADSIVCSFNAYLLACEDLEEVIASDFIDSRDWYFVTLQPEYDLLRGDIEDLSEAAYEMLTTNSQTFQDSFYRSIVPGFVTTGAGLLLVLLMIYFLLSYYVNPIYRMLKNIKACSMTGAKYKCTFDGNDQLSALNDQIGDVMEENVELRRRVRSLREDKETLIEAVQGVEE